jgi:hypothetical protein
MIAIIEYANGTLGEILTCLSKNGFTVVGLDTEEADRLNAKSNLDFMLSRYYENLTLDDYHYNALLEIVEDMENNYDSYEYSGKEHIQDLIDAVQDYITENKLA